MKKTYDFELKLEVNDSMINTGIVFHLKDLTQKELVQVSRKTFVKGEKEPTASLIVKHVVKNIVAGWKNMSIENLSHVIDSEKIEDFYQQIATKKTDFVSSDGTIEFNEDRLDTLSEIGDLAFAHWIFKIAKDVIPEKRKEHAEELVKNLFKSSSSKKETKI